MADPCLSSPGWFKTRLVRGGAPVPARLWLEEDRDEQGVLIADVRYFAELNGESCDPFSPPHWPWTQIAEPEFRFMTADAEWARVHAPGLPIANPRLPAAAFDRNFF